MSRSLLILVLVLAGLASRARADVQRTVAGSLQLDYLAVPSLPRAHETVFDGATLELSLKMTVDFSSSTSATAKVCFACHGFETAAAFVDLRAADELTVRVGRLTPSFGSFPQRYDPANHRTSDKPLPYDMGRMLYRDAWNEGVLPAPWVDNGIELNGTHFFDRGRVEYAAYALSGPKAAASPTDIDFALSHSPYYVDTNSEPIVGARAAGTLELGGTDSVALGASAMGGHYDPDGKLLFVVGGVDLVARIREVVLRAELLARRTEVALGTDPSTRFSPAPGGGFPDTFTKLGYYIEGEVPLGRVDLIARVDGLRRTGIVPLGNALEYRSRMDRATAAVAVRLAANVRIKTSLELYRSHPFGTDWAVHLGLATPF